MMILIIHCPKSSPKFDLFQVFAADSIKCAWKSPEREFSKRSHPVTGGRREVTEYTTEHDVLRAFFNVLRAFGFIPTFL